VSRDQDNRTDNNIPNDPVNNTETDYFEAFVLPALKQNQTQVLTYNLNGEAILLAITPISLTLEENPNSTG